MNDLINNNNIINYIEFQRLSWFAQVRQTTMIQWPKNYMSVHHYLQDWQEDKKSDGKMIQKKI